MSYTVIFTPEAEAQLVELYDYIAAEASPDIAARFTDGIVARTTNQPCSKKIEADRLCNGLLHDLLSHPSHETRRTPTNKRASGMPRHSILE